MLLEDLEQRTLLSTTAISESYSGSTPVVIAVTDNVRKEYINPPSPWTFHTGNAMTGGNTVNILDTSAGIAIVVVGHGDTVNVGSSGSTQGIVAPVSFNPTGGTSKLNIKDSADATARTASLGSAAGPPGTLAISGLAPAPINYVAGQVATNGSTNRIDVSTSAGKVTWNVAAGGMASSSGVSVVDNGFAVNILPKNPAASAKAKYAPPPATATLFNGGGPSYLDVQQGYLADCWLLAGMAEVAARDPQLIANMFTYQGTMWDASAASEVGVYLVRFYDRSRTPRYVQVSTLLPGGGDYYDSVSTAMGTQSLWAALAEKAYAEANGLGYVTTGSHNEHLDQNSYDVLDRGFSIWSLRAITGDQLATRYDFSSRGVADAWRAGKLIVISTSEPKTNHLVGNHEYPVVGYDASSSKPFEVFNPWGTESATATPTEPAFAPGSTKFYGLFREDGTFLSMNFAEHAIATRAVATNGRAAPADRAADPATHSHLGHATDLRHARATW
jgi:Calpain family cysteine protease